MSVNLQPIFTQTVGSGGASSITFSNIPQTFTDLMLVMSARNTGSYDTTFAGISSINGDGGAHYSDTKLFGNGSSTSSNRSSSNSGNFGGLVTPGGSATANTFGSATVYIPNYTGNNYKSFIMESVPENNASTFSAYDGVELAAGLWSQTSAINSFSIFTNTSSSAVFAQYSTFSLYGILRQGI